MDPASTVARVDVMYERGDLEGRDIFLTFLIEPVETLPGITLSLSRCAQSLKGEAYATLPK